MTNFQRKVFTRIGIAALIVPLLALLAGCVWFYQAEKDAARTRAEQQLAAFAHAKVEQIVAWRNGRLHDAALLTDNERLQEEMARYLLDPGQEQGAKLLGQLRDVQRVGLYVDVLLVDQDGQVRLRMNSQQEGIAPQAATVALAIRRNQAVFTDVLAAAAPLDCHIDLVVPVVGTEAQGRAPIGAVVLASDARHHFQPILHGWVKPSPTIEVLLVRRDNGGIEQLSSPSFLEDEPPSLSSLVSSATLQEAIASTGGGHLLEGRDQNGVESLAVLVAVPDSNWAVVAKDEAAAIFGVWRFRAAILMLVFAALTIGGCGMGLFIWQLKRKAYYKALYETESDLSRSLERHWITLQAIGDGIIVTDGSGVVELLNPVAELLTGWPQQQAVGQPLAEVFVTMPAQATPIVSAQRQLPGLEHDGVIGASDEIMLCARNGLQRKIALSVAPIHSEQGETTGTVLAFRDQTEEDRAQQLVRTRLVLREYAASHVIDELIIKAMQEIKELVTSPTVLLRITKPAQKTLRVPCQSFPASLRFGCFSDDVLEWDSDASMVEGWSEAFQREEPIIRDAFAPNEKPGLRFGAVREVVVPILRQGKAIAVFVAVDKPGNYTEQDIRAIAEICEDVFRVIEQKEVEEALLASERRYRTLYRSMMDAFVVTDMEGHIRECNEAYASMLGYSHQELQRLNVKDITPERWVAFERDHIKKQLMHGGCSGLYEKEYQRKDGTVFPVELRTFLVLDNDGSPVGMSAVVRDVTERKRAEEEQNDLRDQLIQSRKMESIGQLAGGIAHDFNNILSIILGYAELGIHKVAKTDPVYKYLQVIIGAGKRSAEITRQLLAFARKQIISPQLLNLNETMGGMLKMLQRLMGENIEIVWLPGENLWSVLMDPSQVDQLLVNLCVNGRDALKEGRGKITIETGTVTFDAAYCRERRGFKPGDFVLLAVSDNGCGIEKDILDKIFDPFFTTKEVGEGTGLGLATVYGIVKQNNGFINVYSEPGKGTTFRLYFPRVEGHPHKPEEGMEPDGYPVGTGESILVVEDDASILALNRIMLESFGYSVLTTTSPREALLLARQHACNLRLLMTDVIMPEMNGRELAREVQSICPQIKVLFVSGYTANVIAHQGVLDKDVFFLPKPFSTAELAMKIKEAL